MDTRINKNRKPRSAAEDAVRAVGRYNQWVSSGGGRHNKEGLVITERLTCTGLRAGATGLMSERRQEQQRPGCMKTIREGGGVKAGRRWGGKRTKS